MSALPKAVQAQIARANEIAEQLKNGPPAEGTPPTEGTPPAATPEVKVVDTSLPPVDGVPPATPPAPDDKDTWQHKYRVLQGKYNAEVPRLQKQAGEQTDLLKDLRQQVLNQQGILAALHQRPTQAQTPAAPEKLVKDEEIETFGADLYDFVKRVARGEVSPMVEKASKPVTDRVARVEQTTSQVGKTLAESRQAEVLRYLGEQVPNWETMNVAPEFLGWLDEKDPYAGVERGRLLTKAFEVNDASRVVAFFKGFLNENAAVQHGASDPAPPTGDTPPAEPQVKMESLVAPGAPKAPTASAPNEAGKRVWSQKEVAQLYAAKNEFIKRGKPISDELVKLERDLFKAQKEGRIRGA